MIKQIHWLVSGKCVLWLLLISNTLCAVMLGYSMPKVMAHSDLLPLFDLRSTGYTYQEAVFLLNRLGVEGRDLYLKYQLVLDAFYPISFGLCYFALSRWLMEKGQLINRFWWTIALLPFLVCLTDYAENIAILCMLIDYPDLSETLVSASSLFTQLKSFFIFINIVGVIILAVWVVKTCFLNRENRVRS